MASIDKLRASDGSGNASVATVQNTRSGGASTIIVDTVQGINTNFFATMGTPHTFTDPVTSETITVISEATAVDFVGHVDGSNLEIDAIAPGYTDNGSAVGDIVIIRPTTQWADEVADILGVSLNDDGTLKDITLQEISSGTANALRSKNLLYNGNMNIWQRNTTATPNDDVYSGADRWNFLAEANASWTVARDTEAPVGSQYSMKCSNVTANNQMAIVQILENLDTKQLDDGTVSLSFWAKTTGTEIGALRAAILTWGSTADSVTSDVIGTWASDGTNPTWATNWTMENAPANLSLTASWQKFTIENVAIDSATVNNLAVVVWVNDGTITSGDDFWITQVQLNYGTEAAPYQHRSYTEELQLCQRYYWKWQPGGDAYTRFGAGQATSSTAGNAVIMYPVEMRTLPTLITTGTPSNYGFTASVGSVIGLTAGPTLAGNGRSTRGSAVDGTTAGSLTAGNAVILLANNNTAAYLAFDAEL